MAELGRHMQAHGDAAMAASAQFMLAALHKIDLDEPWWRIVPIPEGAHRN
ncbi:hypothetical protein C9413_19000 [Rhizobium sp. SEMIA 4085]|nr:MULTISPECIES: hypothetical protein [Rhizobium]NNH31508.1 hypothetical protein [Rhizobium sp. SEMIA 4085]